VSTIDILSLTSLTPNCSKKMVGNKERAKQWYARAAELGHPDASARLKLLGN
jgi:TPR repeat protein